MRAEDQIGFTFEVKVLDTRIQVTEGVQSMTGGWAARTTFTDPRGKLKHPLVMDARSSDGTTWMSMADWPARLSGCWLAMSSGQVPVGVMGLMPDEVGYASLLANIHATGHASESTDELDIAVDLAAAQYLLPGRLLAKIDAGNASLSEIDVAGLAKLQDGRVARIELEGETLLDEIERAGGSVSPDAASLLRAEVLTIRYNEAAAPPVGPPPSDLVMTAATSEQGCH